MGLPFTAEQFFGVFADYNRAFIVEVVALWVASIVILAHVSRDPSRRSPRLSLFLAALWLWKCRGLPRGLLHAHQPRGVGFLAGWGFGHATLNGKPVYQDYEMHFMVTQGLRDRKTLRVNYPLPNKKLPGDVPDSCSQRTH